MPQTAETYLKHDTKDEKGTVLISKIKDEKGTLLISKISTVPSECYRERQDRVHYLLTKGLSCIENGTLEAG